MVTGVLRPQKHAPRNECHNVRDANCVLSHDLGRHAFPATRGTGADESPDHGNFSPESLGGGTVRMVLTVGDPDSVFDQAVLAGANIVSPVREQYGWRLGRVVDPFGHHWEIGRPL